MRLVKDCPRCKGDMFVDRDRYGWHKQCLQCGYLVDFAKAANAEQNPLIEEKDKKTDQDNMIKYKYPRIYLMHIALSLLPLSVTYTTKRPA